MAIARKNPAMTAKTHDGLPTNGGSPGMSRAKAKHSIHQGAAARSNNSTSVAPAYPQPVSVKKGKGPMPKLPSAMDVLAAPRGMK